MVNSPDDLRARQAIQNDPGEGLQTKKDGSRTERVVKMFPAADKIAAVKADIDTVVIGHGEYSKTVRIHPMSPSQMVKSYALIRELLLPIVGVVAKQSAGEKIEIADLLETFGENVDKIPLLIFYILERGNDVSLEWINAHMDLVLDLMQIAPAFLKQNGMVKLHGGNATGAPAPSVNNGQAQNQTQPMEESPVPSPSSADGMDGTAV